MGIIKIITEVVQNFAKKTSIAGISNAANSNSFTRKIIWLSVFFCLMILTIQAFLATVFDFESYPVLTTINVTRKYDLPFPAITICNINRIHCMNLLHAKLQEQKKHDESFPNGNNEILKTLDELISITGCLRQACSFVIKNVGDVRIGPLGDFVDMSLLAFSELRCNGTQEFRPRNCYFYKSIEEEAERMNMTELYERSARAWKSQRCDEYVTCSYEPPIGSPPPLLQLFKPLKLCANVSVKVMKGKKPLFTGKFNMKPLMEEEAQYFNLYYHLPMRIREAISHNFGSREINIYGYRFNVEGFILSCSYRGESCLNANSSWEKINMPRYGNCFTFNSENKPFQKLQATSLTGAANGVSMSFFIDQDNYLISRLSEKAGVRVIVHSASNLPLPDEDGIDIEPGTSTSIAIQKSQIIRLPAPYSSRCFSKWSETPYENVTMRNQSYSISVCQKICLQLNLEKKCGCIHPYISELIGSSDRNICDITPGIGSDSDFNCFLEFIGKFDSLISQCGCNDACNEVDYTFQPTISSWPSDHYWDEIGIDLGIIDRKRLPLTESVKKEIKANIQRNFIRTDIYYQTLSVKIVKEISKYTDESFVSGLGGTMSLYLGIAIIMIFELLELIFDIGSAVLLYHLKGGIRKKVKNSTSMKG